LERNLLAAETGSDTFLKHVLSIGVLRGFNLRAVL